MIKFNDVKFSYNEKKENQLNIPNLIIDDGECILLTGLSGSGKSTITKCINGLIPEFFEGEFQGDVFINKLNLEKIPVYEISKFAGSVFQDPASQFFTEKTISELSFACENYGIPVEEIKNKIDNVVSKLHIEKLIDKNLSELSNGEKQKIAIASVLTMQPSILLLDEPSSNLDYESILVLKEIIKILKSQGMTIIIAEHRIYYLKDVIDKVLYISDGKIKKEYSVNDFCALNNDELHALGLRSLNIFENQPIESLQNFDSSKIKIEHISFSYKNAKNKILNDINFEIPFGSITALVGKNGVGKTTLARILAGIYKQNSGKILLDENIILPNKQNDLVQFVMTDVDYHLFGYSVYNELLIGNKNIENIEEKIDDVLNKLNLIDVKDEHPMSLSGGQKQRLVIATSYIKNSILTVLDEPTSGLDYRNMLQVSSLLKELASNNRAVIIISHDYEFIANTCDHLLLLENGKIGCDITLCNNKKLIKDIFIEKLS